MEKKMSRIQINPQCVVCKRWSVVALWNARPTNDTIGVVLYCIRYNARPTNEPQRVIMIHLAVLCTAFALQWFVVQHFYLAT